MSVGGWVIIDDWNLWPCQSAVLEFRHRHGISDPIQDIDGNGVYWVKTLQPTVQVRPTTTTTMMTVRLRMTL